MEGVETGVMFGMAINLGIGLIAIGNGLQVYNRLLYQKTPVTPCYWQVVFYARANESYLATDG